MVTFTHSPPRDKTGAICDFNRYEVVGDIVAELIDAYLGRIRPQSRRFYENELRDNLNNTGESIISCHAGNGITYKVFLKTSSEL